MTSTEKRILLMDDSDLFLQVSQEALESAGYHVLVARDLAELETKQDDAPLDLVLMDVQMPEAFGDDIAMVLRGSRGVKVPIYLLSSLDEHELADRAAEAEIDGFISKHEGVEELVRRVNEIIGPAGDAA
jgi:DNA-binding response OmpR family regulator